ncbi:MAG: hypothetical protein ACE5OZ_18395 [Candidatus Heimdallarchaeota archaeon]
MHETGELLRGTDPFDPDTDGDLLSDGVEVLGWEITVEYADGSTQVEVMTANPLELYSDTDALNDTMEFLLAGNPWVVDTDGDGLDDAVEAFTWQTALNQADTDHDSLTDYLEVMGWPGQVQYLLPTGEYSDLQSISYTSNPLSVDNDEDGLMDSQEKSLQGNPLSNDTDHDGLLDAAEHNYGTLLHKADSDGDTLSDGLEVNGWSLPVRSHQTDGTYQTQTHLITTNPRDLTTTPDADQDGVTDLEEYRNGGNPSSADTDGDGLTDEEEYHTTHSALNLAFHTATQTTGYLYLNHTHVDFLWTSKIVVKDQFGDPVLPFTRTATDLDRTPLRVKIWDANDWNFTNNSPKSYRFHFPPFPPIVFVLPAIETVDIDELSSAVADLDAYYDKLVLKFMGGNLGYSSSVAVVEPGYQVDRLVQHQDIPGVDTFAALENRLFDVYLNQWTISTWGAAWGYWGSERKFKWGTNNEYSLEVRWNDPNPSRPYHVPTDIRDWDYDDSSADRTFKIIQKSGSSSAIWSAATLRQFLEIWVGLKLRPIFTDRTGGTLGELRQYTTTLIRDWYNTLSYTEADFAHAQSDATVYDLMQVTMARVRTLLPNATLPGITLVDPPAADPPPEKKNWWEKTWDDAFDAVDDLVDIATDFLGDIMDVAMDLADGIIDTAADGIESVAEFAMDIWEWVWEEASPLVDETIKTVENVVQSVADLAVEAITQLIKTTLTTTTGTKLNEAKNIISAALAADLGTVAQEIWDDFSDSNAKILLETFSGILGFAKPYLRLTYGEGIGGIISDALNLPSPLNELVQLISPTPALTLLTKILETVMQQWIESILMNLPGFQSMSTILPTAYFESPEFASYEGFLAVDPNKIPEDPSSPPSAGMLQGVGISKRALVPAGEIITRTGVNMQTLKGTSEGAILFNILGNFTAILAAGLGVLTGLETRLLVWLVLNAVSRMFVTLGDEAIQDAINIQIIWDGFGIAASLLNMIVSQSFLHDKEGQIDFVVSGVIQALIHAVAEICLDFSNAKVNGVGFLFSVIGHLYVIFGRLNPFIAGLSDLENNFWIVMGNGLVIAQAVFIMTWQIVTSVRGIIMDPEHLFIRYITLGLMDAGILASAVEV